MKISKYFLNYPALNSGEVDPFGFLTTCRELRIRDYDLDPDGSLGNERTLYDSYLGRSGDGMAIDAEDKLWVAAGLHRRREQRNTGHPGIHVIPPRGSWWRSSRRPKTALPICTFGGPDLRTLYITCENPCSAYEPGFPVSLLTGRMIEVETSTVKLHHECRPALCHCRETGN